MNISNVFLLQMHDELNEIWSKLDTLQGMAYLMNPCIEESDKISTDLFSLKELVIKIRDKYDSEIEMEDEA